MIFDTHAHYDDHAFDEDREAVITSLPSLGIGRAVNVGASLEGSRRTVQLADTYEQIYGAVGVHPDDIGELSEAGIEELRSYLKREKIVAVGEIGLDYYWDKEARDLQKQWFQRQLLLALEEQMPVNIHSRDASQDTFDLMMNVHAGKPGFAGGIIHCYSGSAEMAKEYVKRGYCIGIGGVVTFKNARVLKEVAVQIPMEAIVVETDCPYLSPVPHRGERNFSGNLPYVIAQIAELKNLPPEEVERITWENACRVYRLKADL